MRPGEIGAHDNYAAAGFEHTADLGENRFDVGDVLEHAKRGDRVKHVVLERQRYAVISNQLGTASRQLGAIFAQLFVAEKITAGGRKAALVNQQRCAIGAAAEVEHLPVWRSIAT